MASTGFNFKARTAGRIEAMSAVVTTIMAMII
jgi:hypothetical protein